MGSEQLAHWQIVALDFSRQYSIGEGGADIRPSKCRLTKGSEAFLSRDCKRFQAATTPVPATVNPPGFASRSDCASKT